MLIHLTTRLCADRALRAFKITFFSFIAMTGVSTMANENSKASELEAINVKQPSASLITGGQPQQADFAKLADMGVTRVVNLRTEGEFEDFDEAAAAREAGLDYVSIPVAGKSGVNLENAKLLNEALNGGQGKSFVHCGSGNRAGALMAIIQAKIEGKSEEEAIEFGKAAGLTRLESRTREVIAQEEK